MMMLGLYSAPPSLGGQLLLDCTPFVQRVSFSTDAHGFEGLSAALTRPLRDAFRIYDAPVLYVGLFWGGQIVWEGRLEDPALSAGNQGSGLSLTALGAWRALSDVPYTALWSTTQLDGWTPMDATQVATRAPQKWTLNTNNNAIYLAPNKNENFANANDVGSLTFQTPVGSTRQIVGVQFDYEYTGPTNWNFRFDTMTRAFGSITAAFSLGGNGALQTGSVHLTFTGVDRVAFTMINNTGGNVLKATDTGVDYIRVTNLRLVTTTANRVNTTFTNNETAGAGVTIEVPTTANMYAGQRLFIATGSATNSESIIVTSVPSSTQFVATIAKNHTAGQIIQAHVVYADEIVKDAVAGVAALNSSQLSSATALIRSTGLDLTDQVFADAAIGDILTNLASLGDTSGAAWETGVYEGRTLFFRAKGSASRAWYVDASDMSVARSLEQLANSVYPVYSDANGVPQRPTPTSDATSIARYGLTRRAALSTQTTIAATATLFAATALADRKDPLPRASIRFDAVYDALSARYPLWLVRAGDTITVRNLPPTLSTSVDRIRTFRISHTSYDAVADTLAVEPELPPPTLEAMLARRAEGVAV